VTRPETETGIVDEGGSAGWHWIHHRRAFETVHRPWTVFVGFLVLTFCNFAVWSIATPLFASPDEPTQVAHAAAAVRGELVGRTVKSSSDATTRITIPEIFASGPAYTACFAYHDTVPASCAPPLSKSTKPVSTTTYVGRYPPLYYVIVGLPSLVMKSTAGIYSMRLVSAFIDAVMISLALFSIAFWSRRRLLLVGVIVAATPMVWFLGGVVNPSGLEISAAICLWSSGLVLVLEHADHPPPGLVGVVVGSTAVFLLARPLSPLWVVIVAAMLALVGGRRAIVAILHSRSSRWSIGSLAVVAIFALTWIFSQHSLDLLPVGAPVSRNESKAHLLSTIIGNTGNWIHEMVGVFGALDTYSPLLTYLVWFAVIGFVVLLAAACARVRQLGVLALLVVAVLVIPVAVAYDEAHRLGVVWQGRDVLPLAVGVPLMALSFVEQANVIRPWRFRLTTILCTGLGVGFVAAFVEALRRYTVGVNGPLNFLDGTWHPPLGSLAVAVICCLLVALFMVALTYEVHQRPLSDIAGEARDLESSDREVGRGLSVQRLDRGSLGSEGTDGPSSAAQGSTRCGGSGLSGGHGLAGRGQSAIATDIFET
jgi:hypothetical protein